MTGGMIQGGWEFVVAAYSVTGVVLGAYAASVVIRLGLQRKKDRR